MKKKLLLLCLYSVLFINSLSSQPPKLLNFGSSCYVNAIVQALYATKPLTNLIQYDEAFDPDKYDNELSSFRELITTFKKGKQPTINAKLFEFYKNIKGIFKPKWVTQELKKILREEESPHHEEEISEEEQEQIRHAIQVSLEEEKSRGLEISQLAQNIAKELHADFNDLYPKKQTEIVQEIQNLLVFFNQDLQQDASEFFMKFLNTIADAHLESRHHESERERLLHDILYHKVSTQIGQQRKEGEPELILNIPLKNNLYQGLDQYFTTVAINQITDASEIFIIALNRVMYDKEEQKLKKVTTPVKIPFDLDIKNYVTKGFLKPTNYTLYAVVAHKGDSAYSGHYVAYIRVNDKWYECNDYQITPITDKIAEQRINNDAYILFYQRMSEEGIREDIKKGLELFLKKVETEELEKPKQPKKTTPLTSLKKPETTQPRKQIDQKQTHGLLLRLKDSLTRLLELL